MRLNKSEVVLEGYDEGVVVKLKAGDLLAESKLAWKVKMQNGVAILENNIEVIQVMKQSCHKMLQFNSYTLRNKDIYLHKIININDYSSINYNNQKMERAQLTFNQCLDK